MPLPDLELIDTGHPERCGCPTSDGSPCRNPAGEDGTCWVPSHGPEDAASDLPSAPGHLGEHGKACWKYYVTKADELGVLEQVDLTVVEGAAECYEMGRKCWKAAQRGPEIQRGDGTKKRNSALGKHLKYKTEYRQYAKELGRLMAAATPRQEDTDDDPWAGSW